jgi:hypothetical protein
MDGIRATPYQRPVIGGVNDLIGGLLGYMRDPRRTQQMQGLAGLLESTGIPKTVERLAYNEPLTNIQQANVPALRPETANALMTLLPVPSGANRAAMAVGRAGERMAERVVPQVMERGGVPAGLLDALSQGSMSKVVPVNVAREIEMPVSLPTSKEFYKAIENEPSAKITDQGLLLNLKRLQNPNQSGAESVRTGVFYLPEGQSSGLKNYKGKTGYGGSEPIEGETLYKNPLFVKGATGGKAPEAAYDQINGKGAYQAMRNDVLKSYGYNSNQDQKIEAVQGILEKYNGLDPDDAYNMAYNIVSNSKTGNTLPYAVQENIVANAVRNAGYDAVLGYGKGRGDKGEFFSEVFDVREANYPTPSGAYELLPFFEEKRRKATGLLD